MSLKNFIGGDDIIITLKPESLDAYQGKITGISINANVFEEDAQEIPISVKVIDEPSEDEPGEEEDPQEDPDEKELPYFECPELETGVRFGENDKELPNTVAKIYTPKGLKSLNVTKKYGSTTAVNNFSAELPDGQLICLLGPSGCGKSTLLNMMCGITDVTEGSILFDGKDVTKVSPDKRNIGMVFQNYALYPHMTVLENIWRSVDLPQRRMPVMTLMTCLSRNAKSLFK